MRLLPTFLALLVLLTAPAGASDSPDGVVADLQSSYEQRNFVTYDALLSDEFTFAFAEEDVQAGLPALYGRAEELAVTQRMFSGQPGQTPGGEPIPPIEDFQLALMPLGNWTTTVPSEFAGTQMRAYLAEMLVSFTDGSVALVDAIQQLYVEEVGTGTWQLRHWQDLGTASKRPTDAISWGQLKAGAFQPVATHAESMTQVKRRYRAQ